MNRTKEQNDRLEQLYTAFRIRELRKNPIPGNFDAAHLKSIHRHIFQDLPKFGITHIPPGVFRPESERWYKFREPTLIKDGYYVSYSTMDNSSRKSLDDALKQFKPEVFKTFKPEEFPIKLGEMYARLDYIHPFYEGNSRTLREITFQFSKECGHNVNWELFSLSQAGRSHLYIARDRPVIEYAIQNTTDPKMRAHLIITAEKLKKFKSLPELLKECVQIKKPHLVIYAGSIQSGKSAIAAVNGQTPQKMTHEGIMAGIEQKRSLYVEAALTPDTLKAMNEAKRNGFEVHLHYAHNEQLNQGLKRAVDGGLSNPESHVDRFLKDSKVNYKNLESGIALSDRAKIYDCSGKSPIMSHEFAEGKLVSGGGYTAPERIKECSLSDNLKEGFTAKLDPDLGLNLSDSGMKFKM